MSREQILQSIKQNPDVTVLVIGGGINGIGTFRDLALQGVDVLMVEMRDFCSGASAASSHMVHGGLRYLENAEFRLVREALHERNRLLNNAPHYVHPLPTTIPIFNRFSGMLNAPLKFLGLRDKPSKRGAVVIKLGLTMYDWFTRGHQTMPNHSFHSRSEALAKRPQLNPDIIATATYYDAWMPYPERICIELVREAEAASDKARAVNYVKAVDADGDTVTLVDELSGEQYTVRPQIVINAAGPWIDFANRALDHDTNFIGGTKGSHIVVDHPELHTATAGHEMFFENEDGRICLFFPLLDRVLIGTTDIRIDDPDEAICTEEEVDYMLDMVRIVFPNIEIDRSHIVFRFSGVRPLPTSETGTTGQISRDHSIRTVEADDKVHFPILSLVGGKWTSFRAFSEQTADAVLDRLERPRRSSTVSMAFGGGRGYPETPEAQAEWVRSHAEQTGLDENRILTLFERYGTVAADIAAFIIEEDDVPLESQPDYSRRELLYLAHAEKIVHLDDFLLRRSLLAMLGRVDEALLEETARVLAEALDWSAERIQEEVRRTAELLVKQHGVRLKQAAAS